MTILSASLLSTVLLSASVPDGDGEFSWSYRVEVLEDGSILVDGERMLPTFPVAPPTNEAEAEALVSLYIDDSNNFYSPEFGEAPWAE